MADQTNQFDAIVVGAGPAGSASAAVLAEYGHRVIVLERERFPRYHIGESLIPFTFYPLERLGLIPAMRSAAFVRKYSIQFAAPSGKVSQPFYFFSRYNRETVAQTWQVLRSEFDQILLDNARAKGAEVREETAAKQLIWQDTRVAGVLAQNRTGALTEYRAPITLDCTGKEAFTAVRQGWRVRDPYLNKVAVWTYYRGARRDPGIDEGATTVAYVPQKGWFWYIPQHNDMVSVGIVAEGKYLSRDGVKSPEEMFRREIEQNAWIKDHLAPGKQVGRYFVTSEFSFHARHCGCEGMLLLGDAFAFLDPIFSSGLMFALKSGVLAGEAVHQAIVERNFAPEQFEPYARALRRGVENMRKLVYAFYDEDFSFKRVIDKYPETVGEITDCLSGDVDRDFSELWKKISDFARLPEDLAVGMPLMSPERVA